VFAVPAPAVSLAALRLFRKPAIATATVPPRLTRLTAPAMSAGSMEGSMRRQPGRGSGRDALRHFGS
jgi:hypothetical protein